MKHTEQDRTEIRLLGETLKGMGVSKEMAVMVSGMNNLPQERKMLMDWLMANKKATENQVIKKAREIVKIVENK